jgi:quinol-cytochrome oxidoreductase complex cytochrome b subunit
METHKDIQDKIDSTFEAIRAIENVQISPFFKDKAMQRLFAQKEPQPKFWSWFTPQWQLAALVCIMVLNACVFTHLKFDNYNTKVSSFASSYGLSETSDNSIFN